MHSMSHGRGLALAPRGDTAFIGPWWAMHLETLFVLIAYQSPLIIDMSCRSVALTLTAVVFYDRDWQWKLGGLSVSSCKPLLSRGAPPALPLASPMASALLKAGVNPPELSAFGTSSAASSIPPSQTMSSTTRAASTRSHTTQRSPPSSLEAPSMVNSSSGTSLETTPSSLCASPPSPTSPVKNPSWTSNGSGTPHSPSLSLLQYPLMAKYSDGGKPHSYHDLCLLDLRLRM